MPFSLTLHLCRPLWFDPMELYVQICHELFYDICGKKVGVTVPYILAEVYLIIFYCNRCMCHIMTACHKHIFSVNKIQLYFISPLTIIFIINNQYFYKELFQSKIVHIVTVYFSIIDLVI